ncbi:anaerobic ribonucleoside-triphosphate reductase activating protein [Clostridium drakei]|uniref:Anaerobic ribonucleoside-triphosphate reductase-activating protein n=1 Tax=Clostridium drakei TaxID=332101 RepID=A0A2U8DYZ2_9CLOT|nr:anaerobic ribonucleoside-triphosphate reductase activating protein [Clostridium drakei]AWI07584.1 anaerobic ribonucleoside-triphosphate reductase activating protein [Clostridium drakei]
MSLNKSIRLSGMIYESLVNGPGLRRVLFSQGCEHNCKGCFNPSTHCYDGGELKNMDELLDDIRKNPMLKGITFSGGDPFEQASKFAYMAKKIKETNLNIWCYTGYTFEYIFEHRNEHEGWEQLLNNIDVLVDGKFEEDKKSNKLKYRGSSNQRIIDVKKTLKMKQIIILEF